jgi:DnaJ-class molecular chaperone
MIYLNATRTIKCKDCKGRGYDLIEGYEYICKECKGSKTVRKKVLMDIETLAIKIGEKIDGFKKNNSKS